MRARSEAAGESRGFAMLIPELLLCAQGPDNPLCLRDPTCVTQEAGKPDRPPDPVES